MKTDPISPYPDTNGDGVPDAFENRRSIVDILNSDEKSNSGEFVAAFSAMSVNGCPYKMVEGEWVPDEDARREQLVREAAEQQRKNDLLFACRTRVLTDDEMGEIEKMGINILVGMNGGWSHPYRPDELERRLDELFLQQFKLRLAAETTEPGSTTKAEGR